MDLSLTFSLLPAELLLLLSEDEAGLVRADAAEVSPGRAAEPQLPGPGQTGLGHGQQLTVRTPHTL